MKGMEVNTTHSFFMDIKNSTITTGSYHLNTTDNNNLVEIDLQNFLNNDIPVMSILSVLSLLGVIGNLHAIVIFRRYPVSPVTILILWMVVVDFVTCFVCIPLELVQIRFKYTYPSDVLCKFTRFLTNYTSFIAGILLIIISVERRQKICAPFQWQLSLERAKILGIVVTIVCAFMSIPSVFLYGFSEIVVNDAETFDKGCTFLRGKKNLMPTTYAILVFVVCFIGFFICAVAYIQIVNVIRKQLRAEKNRTTQYFDGMSNNEDPASPGPRTRSESLTPEAWDQFTSTIQRRKTRQKRYKDSRTMTIMLLIATGVSFAGFILHVSAVILRTTDALKGVRSIYSVLVRGYYLHSSVHPIIYFIVDQRFRTECKKFYSSMITSLSVDKE
ncbi:neuropeptide Y receptor type 4-like [Mytilus californianus]|uniref:neuropeptide Y receptor type 4-like n=1 Tax=Mytilus californianus TaxID=6549 RepID=UPI0022477AC1|nr:neuropeptide Y receptor type 4-like [Mytilus californianus]